MPLVELRTSRPVQYHDAFIEIFRILSCHGFSFFLNLLYQLFRQPALILRNQHKGFGYADTAFQFQKPCEMRLLLDAKVTVPG